MRLKKARVRALLGPTNTGKTHRAIQAMLGHKTGMFGLPLRLLAREVYDRVVAETSCDQVALITGEEKIVPSATRYWICTVEAMPVDRLVAFVGIDEVQLAADRQRGHVFTDRILHCRGLEQTVFMGSDRIQQLLKELVPAVEIERFERLSHLSLAGPHSVNSLPDRSAVVAFSASDVYALAERLKGSHGGAAVVFGALSPRTRNAQVELYQTGRVKHLVATDAIGMGLNLDLNHVALAALRKFDGRTFRALTPAEVGQIAGRAGRYKTDGSFGTLRPALLPPEVAEAVTLHRFSPVRRVFWRENRLDFSSIEALHQTLEHTPPHPALISIRNQDDQHALAVLGSERDVIDRCTGPRQVERLWDVCQVPDFRKTRTDSHLGLLRELALHLVGGGELPDPWVEHRIQRLDRVDGDIETLMARISWIRTWTYIMFRPDWVQRRGHWQQRTRAIEDRLSDALHEALTLRFIDRFRRVHGGGATQVLQSGEVRVGEVEFGWIEGLTFESEHRTPGPVRRTVEKALAERVALVEASPDAAISLDPHHRICWEGGVLGALEPGHDLLTPRVRMRQLPSLVGRDKDRVRVRLERWVEGTIEGLVGGLRQPVQEPRLRGLLYQLQHGLGCVPVSQVGDHLHQLQDEDRRLLARRGVRIGLHSVYLPSSLKPRSVRIRARLWSVFERELPTREAPDPSRTAVIAIGPHAFWEAIGFPVVGGLAVRADVLEASAADLRTLARDGSFRVPERLVSRLALGLAQTEAFLVGLGYEAHRGVYRRARSNRAR